MAGQNVNANLAFLQQYAAGGGQVQMQNSHGQYVNATPSQVQGALAQAGSQAGGNSGNGGGGNNPPPANPAQQPGGANQPTPAQQRMLARRQQQQQDRAQRQAERAEQQRRQRQQKATQQGLSGGVAGVAQAWGQAGDRLRALSEWAGQAPTPGGIASMLFGLAVLISIVVPVNEGYTRLQLLWLTILGRTYLPEAKAIEDARNSGQLDTSGGQSLPDEIKGILGRMSANPILGAAGTIAGVGSGPAPTSSQGLSSVTTTTRKPGWGQLPIQPPMGSDGRRAF